MNSSDHSLPQADTDKVAPFLSVVVPLFREEESVPELIASLHTVLSAFDRTWEIILVDDGSDDKTAAVIAVAAANDERVQGVYLARNYGQTAALQAGFDHARGELVATLDGDLQNDPKDIPRLISLLESEDVDVVCGWRRDRQDEGLRVFMSKTANAIISSVTKTRLHDYGCTLRIYRRDLLNQIRIYGEMHRFLPAMLAEVGARIMETPVTHHARKYGKSKYGLDRTVRVILDLVLVRFLHSYIHRPLHLFGTFGLALFVPGSAILTYLAVLRLGFGEGVGERPLLTLGLLMVLVGVILVTQGLIGEVLGRILYESTNRTHYRIRVARKLRDKGPQI